jgi:hypothetical protein
MQFSNASRRPPVILSIGESQPIAEKQRQERPLARRKSWDKNFDAAIRTNPLKTHPVNLESLSACTESTDLILVFFKQLFICPFNICHLSG